MGFGSFGGITFEVSRNKIITFDEFKRQGSARWETHDVIQNKPIPEFLGPGQDEVSYTIKFSVAHKVNPKNELERLREFRDTGKVAPLIIGSGPISENYWYIVNLNEQHKSFDNKGNLLQAEVEVTLREYPRPNNSGQSKAKVKAASSGTSTKNVSKREYIGDVTVIAGSLNIRSGPALNAKILKTAKKNDRYRAYGKITTDIEWYVLGGGHYVSAGSEYVSFKAR